MPPPSTAVPSWDALYDVASTQEGLFTTEQAGVAGFSPQLLAHHVTGGRLLRRRRGLYRLRHYPPGEHEELVELWLWSKQAGVFSHETALSLHGLSDLLPSRVHLTLPLAWKRRRLVVPEDVTLHFGDVGVKERAWVGPVPLTRPARTLEDCATATLDPDQLRLAARQALDRGLVRRGELPQVERALRDFGGIPQ